MQPVQSPPYGSQFQTASATPPWATDIIEDLKSIKISVSKHYLLLNINDVQALCNFEVLEFNEFSDHSPLYFCFKRKNSNTDRSKRHVQYNSNDNIDYETKIVFDEQKLDF